MSGREGPRSIRVGTVNQRNFAKFLLAQTTSIPEAMVRFMAGPPVTDQQQFKQKAAEARIRTEWRRPPW